MPLLERKPAASMSSSMSSAVRSLACIQALADASVRFGKCPSLSGDLRRLKELLDLPARAIQLQALSNTEVLAIQRGQHEDVVCQ